MALLERYDQLIARDYCRPGCGACLDRCPANVPVDDIFRYAMYFEDYGQEGDAMALYAALPSERDASCCASCPAPCQAACPFELPIRSKMLQAHRTLKA